MPDRDENGQFLPGHRLGGRPPKGEALTDVLREKVDKHAVAEKLIELAMERGDISALKYIYDRIDGRPVETVNQTVLNLPDVVEVDLSETETDREDSATVEVEQ